MILVIVGLGLIALALCLTVIAVITLDTHGEQILPWIMGLSGLGGVCAIGGVISLISDALS